MRLEFARPEALYLLLLLPAWWLLVWPRAGSGVLFTRGEAARGLRGLGGAGAALVLMLPRALRAAAMAAVIVVLADPHRVEVVEEVEPRGKSIGLALDLSTSMLALDMDGGASRMSVAREAAARFARSRPHDELTLVGFAARAITRVPPTLDPGLIAAGIESLDVEVLSDGTDISAAVLTAVARLRESEREPRVLILLTDGAHNGVGVPPLAAARAAAAVGVRIHSISILGPGDAPAGGAGVPAYLLESRRRTEDEMRTVLAGISEVTGGEYFHAANSAALDSAYREIDRIEAPVEEPTEREVSHPARALPILVGLVLVGLDALLHGSRWRVVP